MKFEIRDSKTDDYYYVMVGANGEDMMVSEIMSSKQACYKSISSIKDSITREDTLIIDKTA